MEPRIIGMLSMTQRPGCCPRFLPTFVCHLTRRSGKMRQLVMDTMVKERPKILAENEEDAAFLAFPERCSCQEASTALKTSEAAFNFMPSPPSPSTKGAPLATLEAAEEDVGADLAYGTRTRKS